MAMNIWLGHRRRAKAITLTALALAIAVPSYPAMAQDAATNARIQRLEAEIRALQRKVFPGADGKYFTPEISPSNTPTAAPGQPATSALTDVLSRLDGLEAQITQLTSQSELNTNRITQIEAKLNGTAVVPSTSFPNTPVPVPGTSAPATGTFTPSPPPVTNNNLSAMTGSGSPTAEAPSAQRVSAVRAIVKPQTGDAGDDEYSYGFRLWEAKFFPEAQQQLKLTADRYPRHARVSYTRNLLGRAYLDDGKPREAATWFLQNYQGNKAGERAPDSLLYLAESMRQLKDNNRACIALAEFGETFPAEAATRLRTDYTRIRSAVKCN